MFSWQSLQSTRAGFNFSILIFSIFNLTMIGKGGEVQWDNYQHNEQIDVRKKNQKPNIQILRRRKTKTENPNIQRKPKPNIQEKPKNQSPVVRKKNQRVHYPNPKTRIHPVSEKQTVQKPNLEIQILSKNQTFKIPYQSTSFF